MPLDLQGLLNDPEFQKLSPTRQRAILDRNNVGPTMSQSTSPNPAGFEDTSGDVSRILEQYHEPNRARDVGPRLAMFALQAGLSELPGAAAEKLAGLSLPAKAAVSGRAALRAGAYGVVGTAEDRALRAMGVPAGASEAIVAATGLTTKPGKAAVRAALEVMAGGKAAIPAIEAAAAPAALDEGKAAILAASRAVREKQAAEVVASARGVLPAGQRGMATNLGGVAKPAPAATAPEDLEATLQASLDKLRAERAAGPLQPERIQVGAQNVGRKVGLSKEAVRLQSGPVLDEAVGEASPILPKKAFEKIIDTMKALPKTGGEREAYVARATSGKTKWQVENIRRQLEHLGLLLPVAAAAGSVAKEQD